MIQDTNAGFLRGGPLPKESNLWVSEGAPCYYLC